jgi:tetratricopeptide (TPR) repeat protein
MERRVPGRVMNAQQWARVKELFHGALEQAPGDRAAFLTSACGGNGEAMELRAEVERLLAADADTGSFIDNIPSGLTGRIIGRYEVGRLVGIGGMGQVYAAKDLELRRAVAIKIGTATDPDSHARLKREAQHASQLNHPHICTIHEVGVVDEQPFIVMEFIEGHPLSDVIPRDGLPAENIVRYAMQIADGLAHAHAHGLLHRDLKSPNVIITAERRAKILDFGLAQRFSAEKLRELSHSQQSVTREGRVAGTLSCMAPELLRGESADERSDIWAFGVLLYEMATGRPPFTGATGFELSGAILHAPMPPIPDRIPNALQDIIRRCLAKNPSERYQNAGQIVAALDGVSAGEAARLQHLPIAAVAPSFLSRCWRHRLAWVLAIFLVYGAYRVLRPDRDTPVAVGQSGRPAIAVMRFDNAGAADAAWLSQGVPSMLMTGLAQTPGLDIISSQRLHEAGKQTGRAGLASLDRSEAADVARRAGAGAIVVGSIFRSGTDIRIDAQVEDLASGRVLAAESVRGTELFALVDQLAAEIRTGIGFRDVSEVRSVADVSSASLEAYRLYSLGVDAYVNVRWADARSLLEKAVAIDPGFAAAYLHLALVNDLDGRLADRQDYLAKAASHSGRLSERQRLLLHVELARDAGKGPEAARLVDELVAKFPNTDETYVVAWHLYSPIKGLVHDPAKYLAILDGGVRESPTSEGRRNLYAYALMESGFASRAVEQLEAYAKLAPREPNPFDSLGEAHLAMGLPQKAIEYYSRALMIDPGFPSHTGRAYAFAMLGQYDAAIAEDPSDLTTRAFVLSRVGRYREASEALMLADRKTMADKHLIGQARNQLLASAVAVERQQYSRALEHADKATRVLSQLPIERQRAHLVLADLVAGLASARTGQSTRAHAHLESLKRRYNAQSPIEKAWAATLEGEIALADRRLHDAAAAFASAEPAARVWLAIDVANPMLLANDVPGRDGGARVAKARGDLQGAIEIYRRLLTNGPDAKWSALFNPRYVLEIARLLDQLGDKTAARTEYERFLTFWKDADADLAEPAEARRAVARFR